MLNEKYDLRYLPLFNDELTRDVSYIASKEKLIAKLVSFFID